MYVYINMRRKACFHACSPSHTRTSKNTDSHIHTHTHPRTNLLEGIEIEAAKKWRDVGHLSTQSKRHIKPQTHILNTHPHIHTLEMWGISRRSLSDTQSHKHASTYTHTLSRSHLFGGIGIEAANRRRGVGQVLTHAAQVKSAPSNDPLSKLLGYGNT